MKKVITFFIIIVLIFLALKYFLPKKQEQESNGEEGEEEVISHNDLIRVFEPNENEAISSPLKIKGEARGNWYFEASFPIKLVNRNGKELELSQNYIMTDKEWMTEDYVSFKEEIVFDQPETQNGTLILKKANPSGKPELEEKLEIPVKFK
ncbi:MAG TPA: Gmad2 immunoglobulin-like domain-containing protein [Patescibacteria group bacterium]|nr:Gmad2 immunoglobulin-like domain-containing protein [Patescibacteria group bacterium]